MSRNRGLRMNSDVDSGLLRCEQPPELRGLVFLDLDPHAFCSAPLVLKLAIQDIQPYSVLVSWQSRNHSGLRGYQVAYHALDNVDEVLERKTRRLVAPLVAAPSMPMRKSGEKRKKKKHEKKINERNGRVRSVNGALDSDRWRTLRTERLGSLRASSRPTRVGHVSFHRRSRATSRKRSTYDTRRIDRIEIFSSFRERGIKFRPLHNCRHKFARAISARSVRTSYRDERKFRVR